MNTKHRETQRKGDMGVARAIATFTTLGGDVLFPLTESAAYDLVVDFEGVLKKIQVRYTTVAEVGLRRIHSNSKGYVVKRPKKNGYDWLYIAHSNGDEYLISYSLVGRNSITPQPKDLIGSVFPRLKRRGGRVV